jgi:hypothetical protein
MPKNSTSTDLASEIWGMLPYQSPSPSGSSVPDLVWQDGMVLAHDLDDDTGLLPPSCVSG